MRESWLSFFWTGRIPEMDGLFAWQKHLEDQKSEFKTRLWVTNDLFAQLRNNPLSQNGTGHCFDSVEVINDNEILVKKASTVYASPPQIRAGIPTRFLI